MIEEKRDNAKSQLRCPNCKNVYSLESEMSNTEQICPNCGFKGIVGDFNDIAEQNPKPKAKGGYGRIGEYNKSLSQEEFKEIRSNGGKAAGVKRRYDSNMQKAISLYFRSGLSQSKKDKQMAKLLKELGLPESQLQSMVVAVGEKVKKLGDAKSLEVLGTFAGQKPSEKMMVGIAEPQLDENKLKEFFGFDIGKKGEDKNEQE